MARLRRPVWLGEDGGFPPSDWAGPDGLLAIGGNLRPETLLEAYEQGIFPWPWDEGEDIPMLWWCPDPRFVLRPKELHVSHSLRQRLRSGRFALTLDTAFEAVINACAHIERPGQEGTWITREMIDAYVELHRLGWAHSVEAHKDGALVGGLYGVSLGGVFFGESMFARVSDASKVAFVTLVEQLREWGITLVDCQQETSHLSRFGAQHIPRKQFLDELAQALHLPHRQGCWQFD